MKYLRTPHVVKSMKLNSNDGIPEITLAISCLEVRALLKDKQL